MPYPIPVLSAILFWVAVVAADEPDALWDETAATFDGAAMLQIKNVDDDVDVWSTMSSSCTNRNTDIQDAGSNEGRIYNLNKHDISCHSDEAIKRWQVITRRRRRGGNHRRRINEIRVKVECCKDNDLFTDTRNVSTATVSDQDGSLKALWAGWVGKVKCDKDEVMRQWKLNRPSDSTIRIDYQCAKAHYPLRCITKHSTEPNTYGDDAQGGMIYLDRHTIDCEWRDGFLQAWYLQFYDDAEYSHIKGWMYIPKMFVYYWCCWHDI